MRFRDRTDAGRRLAALLEEQGFEKDAVALALPRGGVAVAYPLAKALGLKLEPFVVRKVGAPRQEELAMGAVAGGGITVRNEDVVRLLGVSEAEFEKRAESQRKEVRRREMLYREGLPPLELEGRCLILVDDGLATGASMKAAVEAARKARPTGLSVAVPVAARSTAEEFRTMLRNPGEAFASLLEPCRFGSVGQWYEDFDQVEDEKVRELLNDLRESANMPDRRS